MSRERLSRGMLFCTEIVLALSHNSKELGFPAGPRLIHISAIYIIIPFSVLNEDHGFVTISFSVFPDCTFGPPGSGDVAYQWKAEG